MAKPVLQIIIGSAGARGDFEVVVTDLAPANLAPASQRQLTSAS